MTVPEFAEHRTHLNVTLVQHYHTKGIQEKTTGITNVIGENTRTARGCRFSDLSVVYKQICFPSQMLR